jgi:hypothetical protein
MSASVDANTGIDSDEATTSNKSPAVGAAAASIVLPSTSEPLGVDNANLAAAKDDDGAVRDNRAPILEASEQTVSDDKKGATTHIVTEVSHEMSPPSDAVLKLALDEVWAKGCTQVDSFHAAVQSMEAASTADGRPMSTAQSQALQAMNEAMGKFKNNFKTIATHQLQAVQSIGGMQDAKMELERRLDTEFQNALVNLNTTLAVMAPASKPYLEKMQKHYADKPHPAVREFVSSFAAVTDKTAQMADKYFSRITTLQQQQNDAAYKLAAAQAIHVQSTASSGAGADAGGITTQPDVVQSQEQPAAMPPVPLSAAPIPEADKEAVTVAMVNSIFPYHNTKMGSLSDLQAEHAFKTTLSNGAQQVSSGEGPSSIRLPFDVGGLASTASGSSGRGGATNAELQRMWQTTLDTRYETNLHHQKMQQQKEQHQQLITSQASAGGLDTATPASFDAQIQALLQAKARAMTQEQVLAARTEQSRIVESSAAGSGPAMGIARQSFVPSQHAFSHFEAMATPKTQPLPQHNAMARMFNLGLGKLQDLNEPGHAFPGARKPIESRASALESMLSIAPNQNAGSESNGLDLFTSMHGSNLDGQLQLRTAPFTQGGVPVGAQNTRKRQRSTGDQGISLRTAPYRAAGFKPGPAPPAGGGQATRQPFAN